MLLPKKIKYKKHFKGKLKPNNYKKDKITFGFYAIRALETTRLTSKQIESAKKVIVKKMKKLGFVWTRIFPDIPVTSKPNEIRMGKGKGSVNSWVAKIKKGQILYEVNGVPSEIAEIALRTGSKKLPIKTKYIEKGLQFNWLEHTAHNGVVAGSSPAKPNYEYNMYKNK